MLRKSGRDTHARMSSTGELSSVQSANERFDHGKEKIYSKNENCISYYFMPSPYPTCYTPNTISIYRIIPFVPSFSSC